MSEKYEELMQKINALKEISDFTEFTNANLDLFIEIDTARHNKEISLKEHYLLTEAFHAVKWNTYCVTNPHKRYGQYIIRAKCADDALREARKYDPDCSSVQPL